MRSFERIRARDRFFHKGSALVNLPKNLFSTSNSRFNLSSLKKIENSAIIIEKVGLHEFKVVTRRESSRSVSVSRYLETFEVTGVFDTGLSPILPWSKALNN